MYPVRTCILLSSLVTLFSVHPVISQSNDSPSWESEQQSSETAVTSPETQSPSQPAEDAATTNETMVDDASSPAPATESPVAEPVQPLPAPKPVDSPVAQSNSMNTHNSTSTSMSPGSQYSSNDDFIVWGIGVQCGVRFHDPETFNDFTTDLWDAFLTNNVYTPDERKHIGPGVFLSLNGTIDIGRYFQVAPFAQGMWAGKQFYFRGDIHEDLFVNTYTAMAGINLWARLLKFDPVTIRLGAGGYGAHTIVSVQGDLDETKTSGGGYGIRALLGSEYRLNDLIMLTLDCSYSYGASFLKHAGHFNVSGVSVQYPEKLEHSGFELFPGVMFYF